MIQLIRRARQRLFGNELLAQGANAGSAALGALILLLLVGSQILNWQWAVAIPILGALAGFYWARRRVPAPYRVAQVIDQRMALADTLSTAYFFSQHKEAPPVHPEVLRHQYEQADKVAGTVDVRQAVPFRIPRTAYLMAALLLVASSLFALRYGLTHSLDLKPPLASILQQSFGDQRTEHAKNNPRMPRQPDPELSPDESGSQVQDPDQKAPDQPESDASNATEEAGDSQKGEAKSPTADSKKQGDEGEKMEGDQKDSQGDDRSGDGDNSGQKGDSKQDSKESSGKQQSDNAGDSSSLMSKVKDAVQNLLSKMKPQQSQSGQQQQAQMDQKSQSKGQQNGKQKSGKDGQQQNGGQQGEAQEGEASEQADNSQDPQGKGTGKSDNQQPSKQPGSGVGAQDGDKSIKQAEQLAAMGKITEIFGKRSSNITGEATLEVQNTSQTLRTQYSQRNAQHTQGGAEISRDEIPVALQPYVTQYFEQVRKQQQQPKK